MMMIMLLMMNFSLMFMLMKHPISMGIILLIQTLLTALLMNYLLLNAWFSYIMMLIMIGGLLILFIYMTSLIANEKFKFNPIILFKTIIIMISSMMLINLKFNLFMYNKSNLMFNYYLNINFNKFLTSNSMLMLLMIIYLLMVLIAVVKISTLKSGPLRQKF
uniref:NADH dehydrogenase subunit 6 n=1 Tax=Staphylinidae sp. BMNH 1274219 TaxID=1796561 RepID=A0A140EGW1_9COLE|nr:NADH dehydrogenase subunit 6 [Staphylinidae sp. BMNH 1274219]